MHTWLPSAIPTPRQLQFQDWEFGIFLHFGIRTFHEGHRDWDGNPMHPAAFNPTAFDADQWAATAAKAGARYMVLVAKHHDGFANWPSAYSTFSVAQSPWQNGRGDVVRDYVEACRRHNLAVGLYYSPAEWGDTTFDNAQAYDDHFIHQITELLGNYGQIDMLWFDGCGSEGHTYDWGRIITEIRRLQPNLLIFNMGDPDYRWVGNEAGLAPSPCWNTVTSVPFSVKTEGRDHIAVPTWLPAECDCRMRLQNWFYEEADAHTVKSLQELMGLYYCSVGRGCNLLLNIGPDRRGLLPDTDARRLLQFGAEIRRRFGRPLAELSDFRRLDGLTWEFTAPERLLIDHAVLQEDLRHGEHVRRFRIDIADQRAPILLHEGTSLGHKAICRFPNVPIHKLRLRILEADGPVHLRQITLHDAG